MAALLMSVCKASQVVRTCQRIICLHSLTVHIFQSHVLKIKHNALNAFQVVRRKKLKCKYSVN
jgi:hypothetical protein